jgi:hypothetical protein
MSLAALVLTVVFIADDPRLPAIALEIVEQAGSRSLVAALVSSSTVPEPLERRDAVGRAQLPAGAWPIGPTGTSVVPAVDGVIVTIDDAGSWIAAFAPPPPVELPRKTTRAPPSPHPWPPPSLPVAGPRALRLFLPAVVDGTPMSASLHGPGGLAVAGHAVAWTRSVGVDGVAVGRADGGGDDPVEVGVPRWATAAPVTPCGIEQAPIQMRETSGVGGPAVCVGGLEVRGLSGVRHGAQPAQDRPVRGVVVRRVPASPGFGGPAAPPKPAPSRY